MSKGVFPSTDPTAAGVSPQAWLGTACQQGPSGMGDEGRDLTTSPSVPRPLATRSSLLLEGPRPSLSQRAAGRRWGLNLRLPQEQLPPPLLLPPPFPLGPPASSPLPSSWARPCPPLSLPPPPLLPSRLGQPEAESSLRRCWESRRAGREGAKKQKPRDPSRPPGTGLSPGAQPSPGEGWERAWVGPRTAIRRSGGPLNARIPPRLQQRFEELHVGWNHKLLSNVRRHPRQASQTGSPWADLACT